MKVRLHNKSTEALDLVPVTRALEDQLKQFTVAWRIESGPTGAVIELHDHSDQQGALGYHDFSANVPLSKVFIKDCEADGVSWSSVVSHELLEMLVDPEGVLAALDYKTGRFYAFEICDPVQGQSYKLGDGNIEVSNFVYPSWYSRDALAPYDQLRKLPAPFTLEADRQGYDSILDVSHTQGWKQITARSRWESRRRDNDPEQEDA